MSQITRRQEQAIAALLEHGTVAAAAAASGVGRATLHRWLDAPAFARAYARARADVLTHALGALQAASGDAVATLRAAMQGAGSPVQVSAARAVLDHALRAAELLDLTERVEALERSAPAVPEHAQEVQQ
jgi:hypothetical protein